MSAANSDSALKRGKTKLSSFDLSGLPTDRNDKLWDKIEVKFGLDLDELGALKNFGCDGKQSLDYILSYTSIFIVINIYLILNFLFER